jgi:hypothetical protein
MKPGNGRARSFSRLREKERALPPMHFFPLFAGYLPP